MVRATAAEMVKLFGLAAATYPPGHDATTFGNFAAQVDAELDVMALPATLSTTATNVIALANREACRFVMHSYWMNAGGVLSGQPEPMSLYNVAYYNHVKSQVMKMVAGTTYGGTTTVDMIDTSE
jgi:hypothetical protein